ncbi:hypothetical protein C8R46DRAFT_1198654 [Mycena filopes]|nr:hypothetical protein C8R46DRAFT_1198654 [Mycena filopes]
MLSGEVGSNVGSLAPLLPGDGQPELQPSFKEEMESIDSKIAWHLAQIALLKARRNSIAPICRLPNELLARIITIYAIESETLFDLGWAKVVTIVCQRWYAVARAEQSLWSFIDIGYGGRWGRFYRQLERSGVAPLTIKIPHCNSRYYIDIVLDHSPRIAALDLSGETQHILHFLAELPNHNFPMLASLGLEAKQQGVRDPPGLVADLPAIVLDGSMPKLKELKLTLINLPWRSVRGLESLSLTKSNDSGAPVLQTLDMLFSMLELCPQLQTLKLEEVIPNELDYDGPQISLPNLTSIYLRDHVLLCWVVLKHLTFPLDAQVRLYALGLRTGADAREILVPMSRRLRAPSAPRPPLLMVRCHGSPNSAPSYCTFSAHLEPTPWDFFSKTNPAVFSLNTHPSGEHALRQIMTKVIKATSLAHITHLDVRMASYLTEGSYRALFQLLPALETVFIMGDTVALNILRALVEVERLDPERRKYRRPTHLHILAVYLDEKTDVLPAVIDALDAYLRLCHGLGTPLPILEIEERRFCLARYEKRLEALFPLVGRRWYGMGWCMTRLNGRGNGRLGKRRGDYSGRHSELRLKTQMTIKVPKRRWFDA